MQGKEMTEQSPDVNIISYVFCQNDKQNTDRSKAHGLFAEAFYQSGLGESMKTLMDSIYSIVKSGNA